MLNYGLAGRVVVVSGATSGIGLASELSLARNGAHVAILGTNKDRMAAAVAQVRKAAAVKAKVLGVLADVRDPAALIAAAKLVAAVLGQVSGLIASAGIAGAAKAEDMTIKELNNVGQQPAQPQAPPRQGRGGGSRPDLLHAVDFAQWLTNDVPESIAVDEGLADKFRANAEGALTPRAANAAIDCIMNREKLENSYKLAGLLVGTR